MIADGACKVQIFLLAPASVAHASTSQIKDAALAIYDKCGAGTPSKGGVATNIGTYNCYFTNNDHCLIFEAGGDNNLAVVLGATSYPDVVCEAGRAPTRTACANIIAHMSATLIRQSFGPVHPDLAVPDVKLPFHYTSCKVLHLSSYDRLSDTNMIIVG